MGRISLHPESCQEGKAVFARKSQLEDHKANVHPNPKKFTNFNGGMFMMMVSEDEDDLEESICDPMDDDSEAQEVLKKEAAVKEEKELREFLDQIVLDLADDIVKTAMTGTVLFALRID